MRVQEFRTNLIASSRYAVIFWREGTSVSVSAGTLPALFPYEALPH